jgi:hypothetical protein
VRYLNPLAVKVSGLFFYPQHPPLVISDNSIRFGTNILTAPCSEGSATMFKID